MHALADPELLTWGQVLVSAGLLLLLLLSAWYVTGRLRRLVCGLLGKKKDDRDA